MRNNNDILGMKLNIKAALDAAGITEIQAAKELFPAHRYPEKALDRVMRGEGNLDDVQITKLASLAGVTVADLFSGGVKLTSKGSTHTITTGVFRAELDLEEGVTKIYKNNSLAHEVVLHSASITLRKYLEDLQLIISQL